MNKRLFNLATLGYIFCASAASASDTEALQLMKLSFACAAQGASGHIAGMNLSSRESYAFYGTTKQFFVKVIRRSVGERDGQPVEFNEYWDVKAPMKELQPYKSSGANAGVKCKTKAGDCVSYVHHIDQSIARNTVDSDNDSFWKFNFCSKDSADDFSTALRMLAK